MADVFQIMLGEGLRVAVRRGAEGSVTAGGATFNSFLRRTVCFVGTETPYPLTLTPNP